MQLGQDYYAYTLKKDLYFFLTDQAIRSQEGIISRENQLLSWLRFRIHKINYGQTCWLGNMFLTFGKLFLYHTFGIKTPHIIENKLVYFLLFELKRIQYFRSLSKICWEKIPSQG